MTDEYDLIVLGGGPVGENVADRAVIAARAKGEAVDDAPWGRHAAIADHAAAPQVVFSEPEVAAVGLTEAGAREAGTGSAPSTSSSPRSRAPRCTPTATAAGRAWSWTRTARCCSA